MRRKNLFCVYRRFVFFNSSIQLFVEPSNYLVLGQRRRATERIRSMNTTLEKVEL